MHTAPAWILQAPEFTGHPPTSDLSRDLCLRAHSYPVLSRNRNSQAYFLPQASVVTCARPVSGFCKHLFTQPISHWGHLQAPALMSTALFIL